MKKYLKGLFAFIIMLFPVMVNAEVIGAGEPGFETSKTNYFTAKGTPIEIIEKDGVTYATWEWKGDAKEQALTNSTVVIGGYYNPCNDAENPCSIELSGTSITMTGGTVATIMGGNLVADTTSDGVDYYANYTAIKSGDVNITIDGGTITGGVFGLSSGSSNLPTKYYANIKDYYTADSVNLTMKNGSKATYLVMLSSYTYIKDATLTIEDSTLTDSYDTVSSNNGVIDNYTINIINSTVTGVSAGWRTMVGNLTMNIKGTSSVGEIYAGSYYPASDNYENTSWNGASIGKLNYGQVKEMTINIDKDVKYNHIYPGFQFVDKDNFAQVFASQIENGNGAYTGIDGSETAKVTINIAATPSVTNEEATTIFDAKYASHVTVNYISEADVPTVPSGTVTEPTLGVTDVDATNEILQEALNANEEAREAIANGTDVTTTIEITEIATPAEEVVTKIEAAKENSTIVSYFDINILLKNAATNATIASITELNKPIKLTIVLPEDLQNVKEGYTRTFYIIREHNGVIEVLTTTLASDGASLTFETDKFSNYALAYSDEVTVTVNDEESTGNLGDSATTPEETPSVPQTFDNVVTYVVVGALSIASIVGATLYIKKKQTKRA